MKPRKTPARRKNITAPIPDAGALACDECGGPLQRVRLERFDFSIWAGMPVLLEGVPGFRCNRCDGETIPGAVINASLLAVAMDCLELPHRLTGELARYLRRTLEITQQELAHRMGLVRETVAQWECGEREISPQSDFMLRGIALQRILGDSSTMPPALLHGLQPILGAVKSDPPPRLQRPVPTVAVEKYYPEAVMAR